MGELLDTEVYRFQTGTEDDFKGLTDERKRIVLGKIIMEIDLYQGLIRMCTDDLLKLSVYGYITVGEVNEIIRSLDRFDDSTYDFKAAHGLLKFDSRYFPNVVPIPCRFASGMAIDMNKELALADGKLDMYTKEEWKDYLGAAYGRYFVV